MEPWFTQVQSDTGVWKPFIISRGSHRTQAEKVTSSYSILCWEVCGNIQNSTRTHQKTGKYFKPLIYGT